MSNTITAFFKGRVGVAEAVYQHDYGRVLVIDGLNLPAVFEAHFTTLAEDDAITVVGQNNRVAIPDSCINKTGIVTVYIYLHSGENDGETEYVIRFAVVRRARPDYDASDEEKTELETAIQTAIAMLQNPKKVNSPLDEFNQVTHGTAGQMLRTKGNGATEWVDEGLPTDEQTTDAVNAWLDDHPEATTTVEDESLTNKKLMLNTLGFVTPQMFGAVGNGISDDTQSFQRCFNGTYKRIRIPQGTYLISDTIVISDETEVSCIGTIKKVGSFDVLFDVGNNCDIQLNIDIDKASETDVSSQSSSDIHVSEKENVRIHDTSIINTDSRYAIWIEKSDTVTVENCNVDTYVEHGVSCRDGNNNIRIQNNSVINGHGSNVNRYPICLNSSANGLIVSQNIVCTGNYIEDQDPVWEGIDAHDLKNAVIANNTIVNTLVGIAIVAAEEISENILIANNVYKNTISHNINAACFGIECAVRGGSKKIVINGNVLTGCGNNAGANDNGGIKLYGVTDAIISNNIIETIKGDGIYILSASNLETRNFVVENNVIDGSDTGINVNNGNGINVTGDIRNNVIKNCTLGLSGNDYYGTGYETYVFAKDNTFEKCTTQFNNVGKGLLVSPSFQDSSGYGREGQILEFYNPASGYLRSVCTRSGDANQTAQWTKQLSFFPLNGDYTVNQNGWVKITDQRILASAYCIGNVVRRNVGDEFLIVSTTIDTGYVIVYVSKSDGTPYNGSIRLSLLVMNRKS